VHPVRRRLCIVTPFPAGHTGEAARHRRSGAWDGRLLDGYVDAAPPDRFAVVDGSVRLTYRELLDRVARAVAGLRRLRVGRGDVVSSQLPKWWEALVLHREAEVPRAPAAGGRAPEDADGQGTEVPPPRARRRGRL